MLLKARSALMTAVSSLSAAIVGPQVPEALATLSERRLRQVIQRSGLFDAELYVRQVPADGNAATDPVGHYLAVGEVAGHRPNRLFDPHWYRARSIPERLSTTSPLVHYILIGSKTGHAPSDIFDPVSYLAANPDVAAARIEPLKHFLTHGALEGRRGAGGPASQSWFGAPARHDLGRYASEHEFLGDKAARSAFETALVANNGTTPAILHILHHAGGGTERAVAERLAMSPSSERHLVLMASRGAAGFSLSLIVPLQPKPLRLDFQLSGAAVLAEALGLLNIGRAIIHQPLGLMNQLEDLLAMLRVPYDVSMHDYSLLCPRSSFVTVSGRYCGEPDATGCASCLRMSPRAPVGEIGAWRETGIAIIRGAEKVECALEDVATRVRRFVPDARIVLAPLPGAGDRRVHSPELPEGQKLRVAVIGHCSTAKGGDFLLDCIEAAQRDSAPIAWSVIGSFGGADLARAGQMRGSVSVTGYYDPVKFSQLLGEADPHLVLFPQRCVETWSYALSEAMASGRMILAPSLGAFGERLRGVADAHHYGASDGPADVVRQIMSLRARFCASG